MASIYNTILTEIRGYTDEELNQLLSFADRERHAGCTEGKPYRAACTYWMCVLEQKVREGNTVLAHMDIKCIHNIFDTKHNYIFRMGDKYRMFRFGDVLLVFSDKKLPYLFSTLDGDMRCIWKYFELADIQPN